MTDRHDSTLAFKAGTLLPTGEFCVNYEVMSPGSRAETGGYVRVFFRKRQRVPTSVHHDNNATSEFSIFPNPAESITTVHIPEPIAEGAYLRVLDVTGQTLMSFELAGSSPVNLTDIAPGIYVVLYASSTTLVASKRLVVIR